jgi:hypothetical protein
MDWIWQRIFQKEFWFDFALGGVVVSILAAYLTRWLDKGLSTVSVTVRESVRKEKLRRAEQLKKLASNHEILVSAMHVELRHRLNGIYFTFVGMALTVLGGLALAQIQAKELDATESEGLQAGLVMVLGVVLLMTGYFRFMDGITAAREIKAAEKLKAEAVSSDLTT